MHLPTISDAKVNLNLSESYCKGYRGTCLCCRHLCGLLFVVKFFSLLFLCCQIRLWKKKNAEEDSLKVSISSQVYSSPGQTFEQLEEEMYHLVAENRALKKSLGMVRKRSLRTANCYLVPADSLENTSWNSCSYVRSNTYWPESTIQQRNLRIEWQRSYD